MVWKCKGGAQGGVPFHTPAASREWSYKLEDGKAKVLEWKIGLMVSSLWGKWLFSFLKEKDWWRVSSEWSGTAGGHCLSMNCFEGVKLGWSRLRNEWKKGKEIQRPTFRSLLLSEWERAETRVRCDLGSF